LAAGKFIPVISRKRSAVRPRTVSGDSSTFRSCEGSEQEVEAQGVVIVEVFVAEGQSVHALAEELEGGVFGGLGFAMVREASGELAESPGEAFGFAEEKGPAVGGEGPAIEAGQHLA
jgi:hypothetical protein